MPSRSPAKPAHRRRRRPGWFRPVPLRARADGWSEARQCEFLAQLYVTGSVAAAAKAVGMSRRGAFRLRERVGAESFADAWDRVLTPPGEGHVAAARPDFRKVTLLTLNFWLETGFIQPVIYRGRMCGVRRKPDNSTLFRLLRRLGDDPVPCSGWRLSGDGKVFKNTPVCGPRPNPGLHLVGPVQGRYAPGFEVRRTR